MSDDGNHHLLRANTSGSVRSGEKIDTQPPVSKQDLIKLMKKRKAQGVAELRNRFGTVEDLVAAVGSNVKTGLSESHEELQSRRQQFGRNFIPPTRSKWFIELIWEAFQDKILIVLIVAAIVSLILGVTVDERPEIGWVDGFAILCAVMIVVFVTAFNDWNKERQFRDLQKRLDDDQHFSVIRDGQIKEIQTADLVTGDIAQFKYGNTLPTDGILISGYDIKINESSLTGEAELVKKSIEEDPMMLAGTQVMEGGGTMVVTSVGPISQNGIIITLLAAKEEEEVGFITAAILFVYRKIRKLCCPKPPPKELEGVELKEGEEGEETEKKSSTGSVLQGKLNKLAALIAYLATGAAILTIFVLILRRIIEVFAIRQPPVWQSSDWTDLVSFIILGIIVLVVAIPEGLPLAITISLAYSVKKMLTDNNLVRHLHACETMGNATTICSDKTGTLTTNRMTVVESYLAGRHYEGLVDRTTIPPALLDIVHTNISINSSYSSKIEEEEEGTSKLANAGWLARVENLLRPLKFWQRGRASYSTTESAEEPEVQVAVLTRTGKQPVQVGNVTECALLMFSMSLGLEPEATRAANPVEGFVKVYTFNSKRKYMATVMRLSNGNYRLLVKGASERILDRCAFVHGAEDKVQPLTADDLRHIKTTVVSTMASHALRTIGLAYRDFPASSPSNGDASIAVVEPNWDEEDEIINQLTFLGVVGIQDPVRPEVPGCIRQCQEAGIVVRMVTGDNVDTARAIAIKCGILNATEDFLVLEGEDFNKKVTTRKGEVSQTKFDEIWPQLRVLARSSPTDKYTLVDHIIKSRVNPNREVVAVTGDGTNDGPALKRADVGFAMGIAGTDVAKEACDIILIDDNFASIVKAVMWGRNVYDSVSKFLQFQLTVNVVAVVLTFIASISISESPLQALQLLWVNLIMDALASLALATERPTTELLKRKPYGRKKALVSNEMWRYIIGHSLYQLFVTMLILYAGDKLFDIDNGLHRDVPNQHYTLIFHVFVLMQLFNEINARTVHSERNVFHRLLSNWIFLVVMVVQILLQTIITQFGDIVFDTSGLEPYQWMWCIFLGAGELIVHQLLLFIPVERLPEPKLRKLRRRKRAGSTITGEDMEEEVEDEDVDAGGTEDTSRARVLWIRNLTRIQRQIRVVRAFQASVRESSHVYLSAVQDYTKTPYAIQRRPGEDGEMESSDVEERARRGTSV